MMSFGAGGAGVGDGFGTGAAVTPADVLIDGGFGLSAFVAAATARSAETMRMTRFTCGPALSTANSAGTYTGHRC
jgi:hypothetical protein